MWICIIIFILLIIGSCLISPEEKNLPTYRNNDKEKAMSEKAGKTKASKKIINRFGD